MHVPEIRDLSLYPPLHEVIKELFGGEFVLHLNLTGFVSTERDWHQDDYLNPPFINGWYLATWMALEDIDVSAIERLHSGWIALVLLRGAFANAFRHGTLHTPEFRPKSWR
jgi:hypothetical protein